MPVPFLGDDFLLQSPTGRVLFHEYARDLPIFDYHCHLPPRDIAENRRFENLTAVWLAGDHYKWRAMRANGVPERFITGDASDYEKFEAWAATVPYTVRNPLYHWTHMELRRPFGIGGKLLSPATAREIYETCAGLLGREDFRARGLMARFNVAVVCTTDDPTDDLAHHGAVARDATLRIRVLPTFRPDRAMAIDAPAAFNAWVERLAAAADTDIGDRAALLAALRKRHDAFHAAGCRISDHGLARPVAADSTERELDAIFDRVRRGREPTASETAQWTAALMLELGRLDAEKDWTMQLHLGALRNTSTRRLRALGPDAGCDTIGDGEIASPLARFLDRLDAEGSLPRTILFNLNPRDNDLVAAMIGNFQDGSVPGKIQYGPAWWFNDQKDGMERHLAALSSMGLLARFVGMVTDSRSFLSYPRHEYFRRILCNLLGQDVDRGELPDDRELLGGIVRGICYENAVKYFKIAVG